jgi:hypothetical protein
MTVGEFNVLNLNEQGDLTFQGNFLGERMQANSRIALYRAEGFYVEVCYHTGRNEIERMEAFNSNDRLVPYIAGNSFELR